MVMGTSLGLPCTGTVVLSVALAFVFGYALTMRGVLRAGVPFRPALAVALAADTVSIAVMDAGLGTALFWLSLAGSLAPAFVLTVPVNHWLMGRGKGHAVGHAPHS
jgi:hypothetical protein